VQAQAFPPIVQGVTDVPVPITVTSAGRTMVTNPLAIIFFVGVNLAEYVPTSLDEIKFGGVITASISNGVGVKMLDGNVVSEITYSVVGAT
jgi:hypothetical protein